MHHSLTKSCTSATFKLFFLSSSVINRLLYSCSTTLNRNMPKKSRTSVPPRHAKLRAKIGSLPIPSLIDIEVVGTGGHGVPPSLMINTGLIRYLFNCGEGTQRIASEFKLKLSKIEHIFITHKSWKNTGGLLGLFLTMQGANSQKVTLHGPKSIEETINRARPFNSMNDQQLIKREITTETLQAEGFNIRSIPVVPTDHPADHSYDKRRRVEDEDDVTVVYILETIAPQPKINLEKCVELGIPQGPMMGQLKSGKTVTTPEGVEVKPEDVLFEKELAQPVVVLECPSERHLTGMMSALEPLRSSSELDQQPCLVVHFSCRQIVETNRYTDWMNSFPACTQHLILNESSCEYPASDACALQNKLGLLHPQIFSPLLALNNLKEPGALDAFPESRTVHGRANLRFHLRKLKGFDDSQCVSSSTLNEYRQEVTSDTDLMKQVDDWRQTYIHAEAEVTTFPEVTFLGTGSSLPHSFRNVSCILLRISEESCMLLDCGEGSYGQMYRRFGRHQTEQILRSLKAVFISHMHADHHMGLFSLALERARVLGEDCEPLWLLAPSQYNRWLEPADALLLPLKHIIRLCPLQQLFRENRNSTEETQHTHTELMSCIHLKELVPVRVRHCANAFGIAVRTESGHKIVYSGDTMPCEALVREGMDCDIVIHEATMEDDLEEDALFKTHSTTSQALSIGEAMRARYTILTHFSQRYSRLPLLTTSQIKRASTQPFTLAFDNMTVNLKTLPAACEMLPILQEMFQEEIRELQEKTNKKLLKDELAKSVEKQNMVVN